MNIARVDPRVEPQEGSRLEKDRDSLSVDPAAEGGSIARHSGLDTTL